MKKILLVSLVLIACLTGCSSGGAVKASWDDGAIKINGKAANQNLAKYRGFDAEITTPTGPVVIEIEQVDDPSLSYHNTDMVAFENMTTVKNKGWAVSRYQDSEYVLWYKAADKTYYVAEGKNNDSITTTLNSMYDICDKLTLTNDAVVTTINGKLVFSPSYENEVINITPAYISVSGYIKVSNQLTASCTEQRDVTLDGKTNQMMFSTDGVFDYYQYEGLQIQCVCGADIDAYLAYK